MKFGTPLNKENKPNRSIAEILVTTQELQAL